MKAVTHHTEMNRHSYVPKHALFTKTVDQPVDFSLPTLGLERRVTGFQLFGGWGWIDKGGKECNTELEVNLTGLSALV